MLFRILGVTLFVGAKNVDENTCYNIIYGNPSDDTSGWSNQTVVKNAITYHTNADGDGAAGTLYSTYRYSTMHNGLCYQISVVASSFDDIEDYNADNKNSPIVEFDPQKQIIPTLNQIVETFKFTK